MKLLYCPKCAGIDLQQLASGSSECRRCHFVGAPREGAINEINAFKRQLDAEKKRFASNETPSNH